MHHARSATCQMFTRRATSSWSILQLFTTRNFTSRPLPQMDQFPYTTTVDAEPLHRYQKGGYHPVALGSFLRDKRYKILHKLGWGGYSTVWAARDLREKAYVAIKICVSKRQNDKPSQELHIMRTLASIHPCPQHIVRLLDEFDLTGPNGTHQCLVFEFLGPSVPDTINAYYPDGRLPGKLAKNIAKQALIALDTLHQYHIGHGDIHTRNLVFTVPCVNNKTEEEFIRLLGEPEVGPVRRNNGKDLDPGIPNYIVRPTSYHSRSWLSSNSAKIVDFGESFLNTTIPQTLHTPLPVRAPEVIFGERLDYRVDLWGMGCMLFELFVGQPPFDSVLLTPKILVGQMQEMAGDCLPERWQDKWRAMDDKSIEISGPSLQRWLEEMYFDGERREDLTRSDVIQLGRIIGKLLRFEPSARVSAREILNEPWFNSDV